MKYEKQIGGAQGIVTALLAGLALSMGARILMMLAGKTVYASAGLWIAVAVGMLVGAGVAWVVRRKVGWNAVLLVLLCLVTALYLIALLAVERYIKNGWTHFLLNANRSHSLDGSVARFSEHQNRVVLRYPQSLNWQ